MLLLVTALILTVLVTWIFRLQSELVLAQCNRATERKGRIKAEVLFADPRTLDSRKRVLEVALRSALSFPGNRVQRSKEFGQIGYIDSCFRQRYQTSRGSHNDDSKQERDATSGAPGTRSTG